MLRGSLAALTLVAALASAAPSRAADREPQDPPAAEAPQPPEPAPPSYTPPLAPTEPPPAPTPAPDATGEQDGKTEEDGRAAPETPPPRSPFDPEETWLDAGHAFIERKLFAPVIRFDRFFSDERDLEPERSRSFLRFRNEVRFSDEGSPVFGTSIRASLKLPGLATWLDRLRLDIAGAAEDAGSALFPDGPGALAPDRVGRADAELRYGIWRGLLSRVDIGAGVLLELPPGVFGRARFRAAIPVRDLFLTRFAQTGYWRSDVGFGTSSHLDFERPLGPITLVRLAGRGEINQDRPDVVWTSELALLRSFGASRAVALGTGIEGATDAPVAVSRYRVFTRLRRDVWRRWLFAELEPEVGWPWSPVEGRHRVLAVYVRLELQFQGNDAPPRPEEGEDDGDPREPPDPPELRSTTPLR